MVATVFKLFVFISIDLLGLIEEPAMITDNGLNIKILIEKIK